MASASLSLLKGATDKNKPEDPAPAPAPTETTTAAAPDDTDGADGAEVSIDVDAMSSDDLDALVKQHNVEVPEGWTSMSVEDKRHELKVQFDPDYKPEIWEETKAEDKAPEPTPADASKKEAAPAAPQPVNGAEPGEPTPKKKSGKNTPAKAAKALQGEIVQPNALTDMVYEMEHLDQKAALELVPTLTEQAEFTFFKLGGVLSAIQAKQWFKPYGTFREYVEKKEGLEYRKAAYWVAIYNALAESKVPWEKVKDLPWSKLKEIAGILNNDNVEEWMKIASENTVLQLQSIVKAHKGAGGQPALEDQSSNTVTTKTFKVHDDQKNTIEAAIEKGRTEFETTADTVALERICLDYLGQAVKQASLKERLMAAGVDAAVEALGEAFPDVDFSVNLPTDEKAA